MPCCWIYEEADQLRGGKGENMKGEGTRSTGGCVFGGMWAARQLQRGKRGRRAWKMAGGRSVMQLGRGQGRKTTEHWGSIQGRVGAACRRTREVRRTKHLRPGLRRQPPQLTAAATRSPTAAQRGTRGLQAASVVLPEVGGALVVDVDPGLYRDRRAAAAAAAADHAAAALARAAPAVAVAPAVAPGGGKRESWYSEGLVATRQHSQLPPRGFSRLTERGQWRQASGDRTPQPAASWFHAVDQQAAARLISKQQGLTSRAPRRCRRTTRTRAVGARPQARSAAGDDTHTQTAETKSRRTWRGSPCGQ